MWECIVFHGNEAPQERHIPWKVCQGYHLRESKLMELEAVPDCEEAAEKQKAIATRSGIALRNLNALVGKQIDMPQRFRDCFVSHLTEGDKGKLVQPTRK